MSLACEVQLRVVTIHILIMEFGGIAHECRYGVGQTTLNITVVYACFYLSCMHVFISCSSEWLSLAPNCNKLVLELNV